MSEVSRAVAVRGRATAECECRKASPPSCDEEVDPLVLPAHKRAAPAAADADDETDEVLP